jgi:hypothetical protein
MVLADVKLQFRSSDAAPPWCAAVLLSQLISAAGPSVPHPSLSTSKVYNFDPLSGVIVNVGETVLVAVIVPVKVDVKTGVDVGVNDTVLVKVAVSVNKTDAVIVTVALSPGSDGPELLSFFLQPVIIKEKMIIAANR